MADVPHKFILRSGKDLCMAMVSSTTPRFGPRCPPVLASVPINSDRTSAANSSSCGSVNFLTCAGSLIISVTPHKSASLPSHRPRGQFAFQIFLQLGDPLGGLQFDSQIFTSCAFSYCTSSFSNGNSSDSIASTMDSSFLRRPQSDVRGGRFFASLARRGTAASPSSSVLDYPAVLSTSPSVRRVRSFWPVFMELATRKTSPVFAS